MSSSHQHLMFDSEDEDARDYMVQSTPSEALQLVCQDQHLPSPGSEIDRGRARKPARGSNPKPSKKKRGGGGGEGSEGRYDHHHYNTTKKPRLIWTTELHQKFLQAHEIYIEKPVPKLILEYMRNSGFQHITRENVASHLQKHRMYLKKMLQNKESGNSSKQSNFKPSSLPSSPILTRTYHYDSKSRPSSSSKPIAYPDHDLPPISHPQHQTWGNQPQLLEFDQTYNFDQLNILQPPFEQPELTMCTMPYPQAPQPQPMGQPSLNGALDFAIMVNLFGGSQNLSNQFPNIDANDHFHPHNYVPNFDDLSNNYFLHDCTMNFENLQIDYEKNMYGLDGLSYSDALEFGYPIKQNEFGQAVHTMFNPSDNQPNDDDSTLPQTSENRWEEQGKGGGSNPTFDP